MIKYTYEITKFHLEPKTNIVQAVEWYFVGIEDEYSYKIFNVAQLPKPSKDSIIDTKNLTEDKVRKWITETLDKKYLNIMKQTIKEELERQKNPEVIVSPPPWINT